MAVAYASARDRLGQTLGGKYVLEDVLGVGGTAVVYRARLADGTVVAIKMLHDYLCKSAEVCRRFKREAYVANILEHPGTVRVLDDGTTDDGVAYLVIEPLSGESLEERRLRFGGQLPLGEVLAIADQLLNVLETAHAKNVVHRDIKPSNLFVTDDLTLKVLDFGIARLIDDGSATSTKTGTMIGTPAFMPPEQALSRPRDVDARTDLWAVGATMFTLLSGQHVHLAESSSEHLVKAATLHARSLAKALPGVPEHVESLVAKALAFSKDERWPSAHAMREALARVRADPGRRIGTSTTPPPARAPTSSAPTVIGRGRGAEPSELRALSVTGELELPLRPRRGKALAVVATAAFVAGSIGFFAARSTRPANASAPTELRAGVSMPAPAPSAAPGPRAEARAEAEPATPHAEPAPAPAAPSARRPPTTAARTVAPGIATTTAAPRTTGGAKTAERATAAPGRKIGTKSSSTVDIYKPF